MSSSVFAAPSPGWFLPPFPNARRPRLASSNLSCRRYTELYQKYQGLFEEKLESFLKTKNCNSDEFMKACQEVSTPPPKGSKIQTFFVTLACLRY